MMSPGPSRQAFGLLLSPDALLEEKGWGKIHQYDAITDISEKDPPESKNLFEEPVRVKRWKEIGSLVQKSELPILSELEHSPVFVCAQDIWWIGGAGADGPAVVRFSC